MSEPKKDNSKKEKDSRKDAFLRQAQAILVSQGGWSDETRLKMRVLADRLKLPTKVYEVALAELTESRDSDSKTRWEAAYVIYLQKQFEKFPGDILTLKAERKAIDYGRKRFELSVDICERLIEQVAESMDKVRISETEALRHAKNEVKRLTHGRYVQDDDLIEQVAVAVADWGVDDTRATQLMEMQLAANRSKRRSRRLKSVLIRGSLLLLGLASVAATIFLGKIIAGIESRQPEKIAKNEAKVEANSTPEVALPAWWDPETKSFYEKVIKTHTALKSVEGLRSNRSEARAQAYRQLLLEVWMATERGAATQEHSLRFDDVAFQGVVLNWFALDPEPRNSFSLVDQIAELLAKPLAVEDSAAETAVNDGVKRAMRLTLEKLKLQRLLLRMAALAESSPHQKTLYTALGSTHPELRRLGQVDTTAMLESLGERWTLQRTEELHSCMWRQWASMDDEISIVVDQQILESVLEAIGNHSANRRLAGLKLMCASVAMTDDPAEANVVELCEQISSGSDVEKQAGITLLMSSKASSLSASLTSALLKGQATNITPPDLETDSFRLGLQIADTLGIQLAVDQGQDQVRLRYTQQQLRLALSKSPPEEFDFPSFIHLIRCNSLAIALIEDPWGYRRFQQILDWSPPVPGNENERAASTNQEVEKVLNADGELELITNLETLLNKLSLEGKLDSRSAERISAAFLAAEDDSMIQAWRTPFARLCQSPDFLLALADQIDADNALQDRLNLRVSEWTELQLGLDEWDSLSLKLLAYRRQVTRQSFDPIKAALLDNLRFRSAAFQNVLDTAGSSNQPSKLYRSILVELFSTDVAIPETLDDRLSNVLLLHSLVNRGVAGRYNTGNPSDQSVLGEVSSTARLIDLVAFERRLSEILLKKIQTEPMESESMETELAK